MAAATKTGDIERSFQDIPDNKITEAQRTAFLMDLGWYKSWYLRQLWERFSKNISTLLDYLDDAPHH
jgi:hypothetical protein